MPNGGSDCCGTCWFYSKSDDHEVSVESIEAGKLYQTIRRTQNPIKRLSLWIRYLIQYREEYMPGICTIRNIRIWKDPFYTYCTNHPHRNPEKIDIPIGPVFAGWDRDILKKSPDTEAIRENLLKLLAQIEEQPSVEYPIGIYRDEIVIWQLGEFREKRATDNLKRIVGFSPEIKSGGPFAPFDRDRRSTVQFAKQALDKIEGKKPRSNKNFP